MIPSAAIELLGVTRRFLSGGTPIVALNDVSLTIERGEHAALAGPSGSGKTTLLNMVGALDRPDDGTVCCLGEKLGTLSERATAAFRRHHIGFVFQDDALMPELTVHENVALPLVLLHESATERRRKVGEQLEGLGLSRLANALPGQLSGGEKQRVAVARAVIHRPDVILADEPTANLDSMSAQRVIETLTHLATNFGTALLVSSHDSRVLEHFTRVIRLRDGCVCES